MKKIKNWINKNVWGNNLFMASFGIVGASLNILSINRLKLTECYNVFVYWLIGILFFISAIYLIHFSIRKIFLYALEVILAAYGNIERRKNEQ